MSEAAMTIRENSRAFRKNSGGLEVALARLVKRRWPDKTVAYVGHEWDLSESEATKAVYGEASKNTLNKLLHHKRGGFGLYLQLLEEACCTKLEHFITAQAERAEHEQRRAEAEARQARSLAALAARLSGDGEHDGIVAPAARGKSADTAMGRGRKGQDTRAAGMTRD